MGIDWFRRWGIFIRNWKNLLGKNGVRILLVFFVVCLKVLEIEKI